MGKLWAKHVPYFGQNRTNLWHKKFPWKNPWVLKGNIKIYIK
jgi:hypothetical protein